MRCLRTGHPRRAALGKELPEDAQHRLWGAIGIIVSQGALAEHALYCWVGALRKMPGGTEIESEIPRSFGRVVKFIRRGLARIPEVAHWRVEAEALITELDRLAALRNVLVHGAYFGVDSQSGELRFIMTDGKDPTALHRAKEYLATLEEVIEAARASLRLCSAAISLSSRINERPVL